jgi:hypothetical protein
MPPVSFDMFETAAAATCSIAASAGVDDGTAPAAVGPVDALLSMLTLQLTPQPHLPPAVHAAGVDHATGVDGSTTCSRCRCHLCPLTLRLMMLPSCLPDSADAHDAGAGMSAADVAVFRQRIRQRCDRIDETYLPQSP